MDNLFDEIIDDEIKRKNTNERLNKDNLLATIKECKNIADEILTEALNDRTVNLKDDEREQIKTLATHYCLFNLLVPYLLNDDVVKKAQSDLKKALNDYFKNNRLYFMFDNAIFNDCVLYLSDFFINFI